jgi:hypothetical protein
VVKWSGGPACVCRSQQTSLQTTHAPLFGSVAVAVLTAPTTVSVSCTGSTTLTFTATTDQPLDGGGLWVEIFEKTMPGGIQYLGGCNLRTTSFKWPAVPRTCAGRTFVGTLGSISNTCPPGGSVASSNPVTPQPWAICLAASGTTLTATTNHELSLSGNKWSAIFDRTKESGETRQDRGTLDDLSASPWKVLGRTIRDGQLSPAANGKAAGQSPHAHSCQRTSTMRDRFRFNV